MKLLIYHMKKHAHLENQAPMTAYMKNQFPFLGIKSVERRKISHPFIKEWKKTKTINWDLVHTLWELPEREYQYIACDYLKAMQQYLSPNDLASIKNLITKKSWWDSVDALLKNVGYLSVQYPEIKETVKQWANDSNIWLVRTAILHQLGLKSETDTALLEEVITINFGTEEFFINKAIGWALREYAKTNPEWVTHFLLTNREKLHPLSWREANKHLKVQ